ncbi:MAG: heparan-alpha-glucosaminide N-acetyltransferase domain-containing protein [Betaproteobacteria bacterium]
MPSAPRAGRRAYIDWARAIAVLLMIEAHVSDAWTRAGARSTIAFRDAVILGGFAAPLFLWLAGLSLVLSAAATARRAGERAAGVRRVFRRGVEIFGLAFLFRLQAFVLSPGGSPWKLLRVDILNVMGPAIAVSGLVWAMSESKAVTAALFAVAAAAIALVTPLVREITAIDRLPSLLQWYVRPSGAFTNFTMLPWSGFVFAGAVAGVLLSAVRDAHEERRANAVIGFAGVLLVAAGFYLASRPSLYRESSFWTSSPSWFVIRVGIMMLALAVLYGLAEVAAALGLRIEPLEAFGRHSLFVYWIHVELVYGYASWLWRGRLPLWGAAVGYAAFVVLMYGAVRAEEQWLARRAAPRTPAQNAIM